MSQSIRFHRRRRLLRAMSMTTGYLAVAGCGGKLEGSADAASATRPALSMDRMMPTCASVTHRPDPPNVMKGRGIPFVGTLAVTTATLRAA